MQPGPKATPLGGRTYRQFTQLERRRAGYRRRTGEGDQAQGANAVGEAGRMATPARQGKDEAGPVDIVEQASAQGASVVFGLPPGRTSEGLGSEPDQGVEMAVDLMSREQVDANVRRLCRRLVRRRHNLERRAHRRPAQVVLTAAV